MEVEIEGRRLSLSNLDKVLYPEAGFQKAQIIDYYTRIAPALLPHLRDRPLTLKRYPNGVDDMFFFEKNCPKHRPPWVDTAPIWSHGNQRVQQYCVANDLPTLVWVANLASIELHTSLSRAALVAGDGDLPRVKAPDFLVFDLDPGPPADIVQCSEVGLMLRDLFASHGLRSFAKTSGSKGLQLYVPLNQPRLTYEETKGVARGIAEQMAAEHGDLVVSSMLKSLRVGKVLIDWSQNDEHKTTVNVYSMRARARPTVSTPVTWDEVEETARRRDPGLMVFEAGDVLERVERLGDLFEPLLKLKQKLPPESKIPRVATPESRGGWGRRRPPQPAPEG